LTRKASYFIYGLEEKRKRKTICLNNLEEFQFQNLLIFKDSSGTPSSAVMKDFRNNTLSDFVKLNQYYRDKHITLLLIKNYQKFEDSIRFFVKTQKLADI